MLGQGGLNKAAEVTLFNIKCADKRTGDRYMDDQRSTITRICQGAEHVSYDPVKRGFVIFETESQPIVLGFFQFS